MQSADRRSRMRAGLGVVALLLGLLAHATAADETIDRVLAVVAGELITLSDVAAARDLGLVVLPSGTPDPIGSVLSKLIDRELILVEVERYAPPEPAADAVDREVQAIRARFASAEAFRQAQARSGLDEKGVRERVREDLRIRAYLDQRFTVPLPAEEELGRFYRERPAVFARNGRPVPFEAARSDVLQAFLAARRTALVDDWVAGLRRRADVTDLYLPGR